MQIQNGVFLVAYVVSSIALIILLIFRGNSLANRNEIIDSQRVAIQNDLEHELKEKQIRIVFNGSTVYDPIGRKLINITQAKAANSEYILLILTSLSSCSPCFVQLANEFQRLADSTNRLSQLLSIGVIIQVRNVHFAFDYARDLPPSTFALVDTSMQFETAFEGTRPGSSLVLLVDRKFRCLYSFSFDREHSKELESNMTVVRKFLTAG